VILAGFIASAATLAAIMAAAAVAVVKAVRGPGG
jgi:hypothetical protein